MQTYVALLRGINVGGNNKVSMKLLKEIFESLGFTKVSTYINSGNVIFQSNEKSQDKIVTSIEKELTKVLGFEIRVVVRDAKNIHQLVQKIPSSWKNDADTKTDVLFLWEEFDKKSTINLIKTNPEIDNLYYVDGAIIWSVDRKDYSKSGMAKFVGTIVYKNMTARNVNTVRKLDSLLYGDKDTHS